MKQPELGLKVAELRQQKGFTQEHLAETYEVSPRTIQRIENGEVDPRSFMINSLSEALDYEFGAGELENESVWLAALHLSSTFCIILVPLLIWSWKKDESYKIEKQGKAVLNFQITIILILVASIFCLMIAPILFMFSVDVGMGQKSGLIETLFLFCLTAPLLLIGYFSPSVCLLLLSGEWVFSILQGMFFMPALPQRPRDQLSSEYQIHQVRGLSKHIKKFS